MMTENISDLIRQRIIRSGDSYFANHNISKYIYENEVELLIDEVTEKYEAVLKSLIIDTANDHNTQDTARRVAKMMVKEIFSGRYQEMPKVTSFPNINQYEGIMVAGPVSIRSTCAHHMQNITGKAYVGIFPGKTVIGLSKFNRIIDWVSSRPQIQEEMTVQIADAIEQETKAEGVAILVKASHGCMTARGVKEHDSDLTTVVLRGVFKQDNSNTLKQEFYELVSRMS
jgi:GTP cyclohydrolase I